MVYYNKRSDESTFPYEEGLSKKATTLVKLILEKGLFTNPNTKRSIIWAVTDLPSAYSY